MIETNRCPKCRIDNMMVSITTLVSPHSPMLYSLRCDRCGYETEKHETYAKAFKEWCENAGIDN